MNTIEIALICLSLNIYNEARSESIRGQRAVAEVTLRRVKDPRWANTVCGVVYSPYQFSWTLKNFAVNDEIAMKASERIAADVYYKNYPQVTTCADHYYNPDFADPRWADDMKVEAVIGNHIFLCSEK